MGEEEDDASQFDKERSGRERTRQDMINLSPGFDMVDVVQVCRGICIIYRVGYIKIQLVGFPS